MCLFTCIVRPVVEKITFTRKRVAEFHENS